jgi:TolA-binding protein
MNKNLFLLAGFAAAAVAIGFVLMHRSRPVASLAPAPTAIPVAAKDLRAFVEKNKASTDPVIQDRVGAYKIRLAYKDAERGDFNQARSALLETAKTYKGTGVMSSDFGGVPDQAAYQAAVCLVAEGKKGEAEAEFLKFMKERPLSPLVTAAYRRICRLRGGIAPACEPRARMEGTADARPPVAVP